MLEVRGLTVRFGTTLAVDGLDLDVGAGERVALVGPNGAGKTSTLTALSRVVPATGTVRFDGVDLRRTSADAVARMGLIHVPEGRHVFPTLSVHENLLVGTTARHGRSGWSVDDVYDLFPLLQPLRDRSGWALSGGEQQMVAVGRALMAAPRMLLLDEPSLGLAPVVVDAVFEALEAIGRDVPLLLVEQNTARALELCQRAYLLAQGRVVAAGPSGELGDRRALLAAYLGSDVGEAPGAAGSA
jgi:branched-chain amino acid transport system ATP-binding protein